MKSIENNFKNVPIRRINDEELKIIYPLLLELASNELVECINIIPKDKSNSTTLFIHIIITSEQKSNNLKSLENIILKNQFDIYLANFHNEYRFNVFGMEHFYPEELFREEYLKELASSYIYFDRHNYFSELQDSIKSHPTINNLVRIENIEDLNSKTKVLILN